MEPAIPDSWRTTSFAWLRERATFGGILFTLQTLFYRIKCACPPAAVLRAQCDWVSTHVVSVMYRRLHSACSRVLSVPIRLMCFVSCHISAILQAVFYWCVSGVVEVLNRMFQCISSYERRFNDNRDISLAKRVLYSRFLRTLLPFLSQKIIPDPNEAEPKKYETRRVDVEEELREILKGYSFESLPDMGSRMCRFWFRATPLHDPETKLVVSVTKAPIKVIRTDPSLVKKLFKQLMVHPYIQPVLDFGYLHGTANVYHMQPELPSLKDCIYQVARYDADWSRKYSRISTVTINREKVALFGRQIIEAILFLYEQGFPPVRHFHSGNVFVESDGHCRLGGYENLFPMPGYRTRLFKLFDRTPTKRTDVLMFGHLVFEMIAGYELTTMEPLGNCNEGMSGEFIDVLEYIFSCETFEEVLEHSFFQVVELKHAIPAVRLTKDVKSLLKVVSSSPSKKKKWFSRKKKCHMQ